ncbi:hypothetical protein FC64_GL000773 [Ligilactobacillus araffinosus DSM 20653]|uniref:Uncharacterized protein n=2 Tax=Ligilactobacillus araffinosus TaxID=147809 RepID=A0A0R1ZKF7_9LACO|nr:hypothetical protein FC64_GL000773 [Ligilactobacillus araffinosus DSM 20653]
MKFNKEGNSMSFKIKNKALLLFINFLPFTLITLGLISFIVGSYLINPILGTFILGIALIVIGLMIIPIKVEGDGN